VAFKNVKNNASYWSKLISRDAYFNDIVKFDTTN